QRGECLWPAARCATPSAVELLLVASWMHLAFPSNRSHRGRSRRRNPRRQAGMPARRTYPLRQTVSIPTEVPCMAERKPAKKASQKAAKRTSRRASAGFTDEERAAMRERARELRAEARRGRR